MTCVECGHRASDLCWVCSAPVCGNCESTHCCKPDEEEAVKRPKEETR